MRVTQTGLDLFIELDVGPVGKGEVDRLLRGERLEAAVAHMITDFARGCSDRTATLRLGLPPPRSTQQQKIYCEIPPWSERNGHYDIIVDLAYAAELDKSTDFYGGDATHTFHIQLGCGNPDA